MNQNEPNEHKKNHEHTDNEEFHEHDDHLELYAGDPQIASKDAVVPRWLKLTYLVLPIWGVITFCIFWNGSHGWLDRGYWNQLQKAALTTFPKETIEELGPQKKRNP